MRALLTLTISLSSLDLLEQALEPTERGRITANPEELDTPERANIASALTVPDVFQDGRERSDTWKHDVTPSIFLPLAIK